MPLVVLQALQVPKANLVIQRSSKAAPIRNVYRSGKTYYLERRNLCRNCRRRVAHASRSAASTAVFVGQPCAATDEILTHDRLSWRELQLAATASAGVLSRDHRKRWTPAPVREDPVPVEPPCVSMRTGAKVPPIGWGASFACHQLLPHTGITTPCLAHFPNRSSYQRTVRSSAGSQSV